jgi:O-antigen/teichoic acid export membrane protein
LRAPFWGIALGQLLAVFAPLLAALLCLKHSKPQACPRLDYWDKHLGLQILKPSAFFAFFTVNQFLIFQAPVLLVNRAYGANAVVAFTISRTLFSFIRQGTSLFQAAIAPEVTRLNGVGDRHRLLRVYLLSESTVLAVSLVINAGVLLMSPTILWLWLRRPGLFDLNMFLLMMVVSILMSVKDYKLYFQYATNNHRKTALVTLLSYLMLIAVSYPTIGWIGVNGFLILWAAVEIVQIGFLHAYNVEFLQAGATVTLQPALRLAVALAAVVTSVASTYALLPSQDFVWDAVIASCAMALLSLISYRLFGLHDVLREWQVQLFRIISAKKQAEIA